jgi:hypothetical protein
MLIIFSQNVIQHFLFIKLNSMKYFIIIFFISVLSCSVWGQNTGNIKYLKFKEKDKYGLCDVTGKIKLPAKYDNIVDFSNEYIVVNNDNKCQLLDMNANALLELDKQVKSVEFFS